MDDLVAQPQQQAVPLTTDREKRLVRRIMERYDAAADGDRAFKDECLIAWKHLHNILPANWPFYSDFFEPETQITATETVEQIMQTIFAKETYFDVRPDEGQDQLRTEKMREYMKACYRAKHYKVTKYYQMQECVDYGNGVEWHGVEPTTRRKVRREPVLDEFGFQVGVQEVREVSQEWWPSSKIISRFDCYPGPTGETIQKMPYFIHRLLVPIDNLRHMARVAGYQHIDELTAWVGYDQTTGRATMANNDIAYDLFERLAAVGYDVRVGSVSGAGAVTDGVVKYAELLYYWEGLPGEEGGGYSAIIANRNFLLREWPENPWHHGRKPYSEIKYLAHAGNVWQAMGLPQLIKSLQQKLNLRHNQASDAIVLNNNPPLLVGAAAGIKNLSVLDHWPGAQIPCEDPNAIKHLERPHVGQDLLVDLDLTRASIQRVSKILDVTRNLTGNRTGLGKGVDTLGGMQLVQAQQQQQVNFKLLLNEEQGIVEGHEINGMNLQQVTTNDRRFRMEGRNEYLAQQGFGEQLDVTPDEIAGEWKFYAVGSSRAMETPEQGQLVTGWLREGLQDPEIAIWINKLDSWKKVGEMLGVSNPTGYLKPREQVMQEQQQQAQLAQAAALAQGLAGAAPAGDGTQIAAGAPA